MSPCDQLGELWAVIDDRYNNPSPGSYVSGLATHAKGIDKALEKVGEEATEFIIAVKNGERARIVEEAADLQFHLMVALRGAGVEFDEVLDELAARKK
ncbi:phosphoribosyl-ATP pyrophosphohydrolase [Methanolinea mesophila]|uniref:phosphoribosyl-ATP diphosphatase n=1 Tax=Methanolinea mesophila TaxID=547055 RepID=UPI001AE5E637|nr:phosphoribosyl-ATP diphosphatase [Methanolinea mesophila]MBP1927650.1 phosphoribosyl-ATP pyrophosphohydrolase [Methanolinea mesophila]